MNKVFLIGNLCGDPVTRTTQTGKTVAQFTIAVNRRDKGEVDFFRISAWDRLGDNCAKWLIKGKKVSVIGSVSASAYIGQDGKARANLEVTAQDVEFYRPLAKRPQRPRKRRRKRQAGSWMYQGRKNYRSKEDLNETASRSYQTSRLLVDIL